MSQEGMFNPEAFFDQETTAENATVVTPCPVGEYPGIIKTMKIRTWQSKADPTINGVSLDIFVSIENEEVRKELGRAEVLVKHTCSLDMDGNKLSEDPKANVDLGRVRQAVGLNKKGKPFKLNMLLGQALRVIVSHRQDEDDPSTFYAEIKRGKVAAL